jgi:uncharacterized protein YraI
MNLTLIKEFLIRCFCTLLCIAITINLNANNIYQTTADLNVRSGPSSKYNSLGVIKKGEKVTVTEKTNPRWFKIEYNGQSAYISSKFLDIVVVESTDKIESQIEQESENSNSTILFIIIGVITFFIIRSNLSKKKMVEQQKNSPRNNPKAKSEWREELVSNLSKNIKVTVITSSSSKEYSDNSIIDVTDQSYIINTNNNLKKYSSGVPYWTHHYVYSYSEINSASVEQKKFYSIFKTNFLNGEYFDLEGNTNYAFILLFDLLNEYEIHKEISKLESQLKNLGQCYPKTKSYGVSFLIEKMELDGYSEHVARLREENRYSYQNYNSNYDYNYWRLGSKYKTKLNLNDDEVILLNKLWSPSNNFCNIEFCCLEVLKLYLAVISELKAKYEAEGTRIEKEFTFVADVIARKHFKYRSSSQNYNYSIESTINTFYSTIFKYCENAVRESYGHKRKLNTDSYYTNEEAKSEFDSKIITKVTELLLTLISKITPPDEATEIELNSQTTSRWKIKFEELTTNFKSNSSAFIEDIIELGKVNKKNPSVENIFLEASKFIAKYDKIASLTLYVHYLYHDLKSATFDNKQLTKTIQKSLFKTNEQLHDFEQIVSELIKDKNLDKALNAVPKIYEVKRKKIQLDRTTIKEVQQQHSGTVELLNEYLRDEFEDENNSIQSQEISSDEIKIEITRKKEESNQSGFLSELSLNPTHISVLELFSKNNFSIPQIEIEEFAKSRGVFKNQLIESINESCYEVLDDVLIEEEDDYYTIIPEYFQKISAK